MVQTGPLTGYYLIMVKIESIARKILGLVGVEDMTEDMCLDENHRFKDNVVVGDDYYSQQWCCLYTVPTSLEIILGEPLEVLCRGDGVKVLNWTVGPVLVVQRENRVELFEKYEKVSRPVR